MAEVIVSAVSNLSGELVKRVHSILGVKQELEKLRETVNLIQAMLLDAQKKQKDSEAIRVWIMRVKEVMYDAEDLLDLVATDSLLKQQTAGTDSVRSFFSRSNPIMYNKRIAKKLRPIRKTLGSLCKDMDPFRSTPSSCGNQSSASYQIHKSGSIAYQTALVGRDDDRDAVLKFLFDESRAGQSPSPIAIVGVGCAGKTTLAQLVHNHEVVKKNFERRWWATISDIHDEKGILGRILQSISMNKSYGSFTISELYSAIAESMKESAGKYLLVLDDVWNSNASMWFDIMSLLRSGMAGSRIIITTRSMEVANAMSAERIHHLHGLTHKDSWELFQRTAFQPGQDRTPDHISLGREIVTRCQGLPLAIKTIASLLSTKNTIEEWKTVTNEMEQPGQSMSIISVLKLSYNELPMTLKLCLAYCSIYPCDYAFQKEELTYLWISQGYVIPTSDGKPAEEIGSEYFMELLDRSFFQDAVIDEYGEVLSCKMHDLIHDLVIYLGEPASIIMRGSEFVRNVDMIRHLSVSYGMDSSWNIQLSRICVDRLRSFLFLYEGSLNPLDLAALLPKFKVLRALNLRHQKIETVPRYIGYLKHLRYLNLSYNKFRCLPDSITMLVNLLTLDISWCEELELLPDEFRKLCNLRHLDTKKCYRLRHMPPKLEELTSLQCLSFFKVGKSIQASPSYSGLDVLARLKLKGEMEIKFDEDRDCYKVDECWQLPVGIKVLTLQNYPATILPNWEITVPSLLPNLVGVFISSSPKIKHIWPLKYLPCLQTINLSYLEQLEYIQSGEDETRGGESALLFPRLKVLKLEGLPKLKGWSQEAEAVVSIQCTATELVTEHSSSCSSLSVLADLTVRCCRELKCMPRCPNLHTLELNDVSHQLIQLLLTSWDSSAPLSSLETIAIWGCDLQSFEGDNLTSLRDLQVRYCDELKSLYLHETLEVLVIQSCPNLELWEEETRGVSWDSLPKLRKLTVIGMPNPEKLPDCLHQLEANSNLAINME